MANGYKKASWNQMDAQTRIYSSSESGKLILSKWLLVYVFVLLFI